MVIMGPLPKEIRLTRGEWDQMRSLAVHGLVWDGDLISKEARTSLVEMGFAYRCEGFTGLTALGQKVFDEGRI